MSQNYKIPIIVDLGSSEIKAGFSGQEEPKALFSTSIGELKRKKTNDIFKKENKKIYVGEECINIQSELQIRNPLEKGLFTKEEDISTIFNHIYSKLEINDQQIKEYPLLVAEPLLNPDINREKIASVLFEKLGVPALIFGRQPLLSLFSTASTTGVVLESGDAITQSCSIFEGYSFPASYLRYDYGGRDVTNTLKLLLNLDNKYNNNSFDNYNLIKKIKENQCYLKEVIDIIDNREIKIGNVDTTNYILPDGFSLELKKEKVLAPEILFNSNLIGKEDPTFPEMIISSINSVDITLRQRLYGSINLCGGNTAFIGIEKKIKNCLEKLFPKHMSIKIYKGNSPQLSCWTGGIVVSSLGSFKSMFVTQNDWKEKGKNIIHTKCI